jgi:hypothetical protein
MRSNSAVCRRSSGAGPRRVSLAIAGVATLLALSAGVLPLSAARADTPAKKPDSSPITGLVDLRPKFERGVVTRYTMVVDSKTKNAVPGDPKKFVESSTAQTIGLRMKVLDVKDGESTVELVYESMKIKAVTDGETFEFDSNAKPDPKKKADPLDPQALLKPIFDQIVGQTMTMTVDSDGRIKDIKGGEALGLLGQIPGGGGGAVDPKALGQLFGPISSSGQAGGKRRVGEKWTSTDDLSVSALGDFRMVTDHTLQSHSAGRAEVLVNGRAEAKSEGDAMTSPNALKLKASRYTGKYVWDTIRGKLSSMEIEQSVSVGGAVDATTSSTMKVTEKK